MAAAGIFITDEQGYLEMLYPHSGHYRPGEADMQRILYFIHQLGVDLKTFQVDIQQLIRVNRHDHKTSHVEMDNKKRKKTESLHLQAAANVAYYLSHKAKFIGGGIQFEIENLQFSYACCH